MQTTDQRRAKHAWDAVKAIKAIKEDKSHAKKYGGQAKKLPTRIMSAGLGQALAFLRAKDYAPALLVDVADWVLLRRREMAPAPTAKPAQDALIQEIMKRDSDFLRWATDEALAYLQWLNRFADAEGITDEEV
jgi:CRISPR-associated protein Cmr5